MKQVEVAAKLANVDWIVYSHDRKHIYAASEVDSFNGKPTGEVASYRVENGKLRYVHTVTHLLQANFGGGRGGGQRGGAGGQGRGAGPNQQQ